MKALQFVAEAVVFGVVFVAWTWAWWMLAM